VWRRCRPSVQHAAILNILQTWRIWRRNRPDCLPAPPYCCANHPVGCPDAWFGRRSGIKEKSSAISRHGGQPRSRPNQASGRTNTQSPMQGFRDQPQSMLGHIKPIFLTNGISHRPRILGYSFCALCESFAPSAFKVFSPILSPAQHPPILNRLCNMRHLHLNCAC
jgi:hypothetical protein